MGNIDISGAGSCPGGVYENITVSGAGKVKGDVKCIKFSGSGAATVVGNIVSEVFKCSGSGHVHGSVEAKQMQVSGSCVIEGDVTGGEIRLTGSSKILGKVKCEKLNISGAGRIGKSVEAEEIYITGSIRNQESINAEKVVIECCGAGSHCEFNEIGASSVSINSYSEASRPYIYRLFGKFTGYSSRGIGKLIEGDDICIRNATITTVRGTRIKIEEGCEINRVEYTESIEIHESARVNEVIKL